MGRELIGKKKNDIVTVETVDGEIKYKVISIHRIN